MPAPFERIFMCVCLETPILVPNDTPGVIEASRGVIVLFTLHVDTSLGPFLLWTDAHWRCLSRRWAPMRSPRYSHGELNRSYEQFATIQKCVATPAAIMYVFSRVLCWQEVRNFCWFRHKYIKITVLKMISLVSLLKKKIVISMRVNLCHFVY